MPQNLVRTAAMVAALTPVAAAAHTPQASAPPISMIAFEMNSWGSPLTQWQIDANGDGYWTGTAEPGAVRTGPPAKPVKHDLTAGKAAFANIARLAADLPVFAPEFEGCKQRITDQPYGKVRITRGATTTEFAYNAGCMDAPYLAFLAKLKALDQAVGSIGSKAPVVAD